ncbi:MAG: alpha/beta fold hydrolase [Patescibacteria group bacterium]
MPQKRIFLIHGWGGGPDGGWLSWLKAKFEGCGYKVIAPQMPNTETPKIKEWVAKLSEIVGSPDEGTFFIGHSIGCQAILRYLETLPPGIKVGGALFVAGWLTLTGLETEEDKEIAGPWLKNDIDFEKIKKHYKRFIALFSDDDPFVPLENKKFFEEKLNAKTKVEHNMGHFDESEVPVILDLAIKILS